MSKAYRLSDQELLACARLCQQEQGTAKGAAAEMSLALNLYEKNSSKYSSVYDYMRNSGWFSNAAYFMDYGKCSGAVLEAVSDVLAGNRTVPEYVDEHDSLGDIELISTGSKTNRSDYIPDVTVIKNVYGAVYTFYCFPDEWADPFGYTSKPAVIKDPVESAVTWMINLANDDSHGYSQANRWGPDYDCSSAVISAWKQAGIPLSCTYTGNMYEDMTQKGFADVTSKIDLSSGVGLLPGDVLLNHVHHTAMYIGDGLEAEASINEKGTATGGKPGDQTGREILIRAYRNYPWDCVLRYVGDINVGKKPVKTKSTRVTVPYLRKGCVGAGVKTLQMDLNQIGNYGLDVDGEFGPATDRALRGYQDSKGIKVSGIRDVVTFRAMSDDITERTYSE